MRKYIRIMAAMTLALLCGQKGYAQTSVSGTVCDADGAPIPGVAVIVSSGEGRIGTSTDAKGVYRIDPGQGKTLTFSSIGYVSKSVDILGRSVIDVTLEDDLKLLDESVVVGFATQRKVNVTGAVATLKSDKLENVPVNNPVLALQGQIPGLSIKQTSGQMSKQATITLRGQGTIGQGSSGSVLVLIDGMEGDLYTLNAQDIENISVLKDAAASSIYGSRAPFGVILVTTKNGRQGKTQINYNNSFRFNTPVNLPHSADSYSWALYFNDCANNDGNADDIGAARLQRIKDYQDGVISYNTIPVGNQWGTAYTEGNDNIDYYDVFYKDVSMSQEHNVSISGGDARTNWYISGNYLKDDGLFRFENQDLDGSDRLSVFGKLETRAYDWLKIGFSSRFIRDGYHEPTALSDDTLWYFGQYLWPVAPLYDPNGNLFNDLALRFSRGGQRTISNITSATQFNFELTPLKGWRIVGDLNYRYRSYFNKVVDKEVWQTCIDGVSKGSSWDYHTGVSSDVGRNQYINANLYTDYETHIGDHYFKAMAGVQAESYDVLTTFAKREGLIVPEMPWIDATSGMYDGEEVSPVVGGGASEWRTLGFFGRLNYNYKEKYLVEANLRYDGSSRFAAGSRWGLFPSLSLGWNMAKEPFFADAVSDIQTLKFRLSYGSLGNQNTTSWYPTYSIMNFASSSGSWLIDGKKQNIAWPASLISSSLTWETVKTWNAGLDVAAFDGRLSAALDLYVRKTEDMVGPADELPVILGTSVPYTNNTDMKTKGFDFEISWNDRAFGELDYGVRFVLSDAVTEITKYSNPSKTLGTYYNGMKLGDFWGYETVGIARTDEEMLDHLISLPNGGQNAIGSNWQAGDIMYKDLNGDGKIDSGSYTTEDHGDQRVIGNMTPRFNYGLDLNFAWRGIDLRVFLQGVGKRDFFQHGKYFFGSCGWSKWGTMVLKQHLDYFRDDPESPLGLNTDSYYPRPYFDTEKNVQWQTGYVQDASYLRLKNLQVGYTIPGTFTRKFGVEKLRLYFSGENLATFTRMTDLFDPETVGENETGNVYPLSKTWSCGLSVTF